MRADARRNRDAVLDAGARLLSERPHASMQEIADASGLGRTTVYRHFKAREELVAALIEHVVDEATRVLDECTQVEPATEALRSLASNMFALGRRFAFLRAHREDMRGPLSATDRRFCKWVKAQQARGELRADVDPAWVLAACRGLITTAIDEADELDDAQGAVSETLVAAFGPGPR